LFHDYIALAGNMVVGKWVETFKDFPPIQKPNTFTIDQAMEKMKQGLGAD
jgi:arylsulfatase